MALQNLSAFGKNYENLQTIYKNKFPKDLVITPRLALIALKQSFDTITTYQRFPENIKQNKEVALALIKSWYDVYGEIPKILTQDMEFIKDAFKVNAKFYHSLPDDVQKDREVFKAALSSKAGGWSLYDSSRLIFYHYHRHSNNDENRELALAALESASHGHAPLSQLISAEVVPPIVTVFRSMPKELKDFQMTVFAIKLGLPYKNIPDDLAWDEDVALAAVIKDPANFQQLAPHLQNDNRILMAYRKAGGE